jgi:DNA-binding response OmpR family regulator
MLKLLLEYADYSVVTAASGKEALAAAANYHIDLVLIDFGLPDMTGANVVRRLRQMGERMATVPIVMHTAFDGYEYRRLAHEAGCDAYLVKPPDFEILRGTLERLLREKDRSPSDLTGTKVVQDFRNPPREAVRT